MFFSCQKLIKREDHYKLLITLDNAPFDSIYLFDYINEKHIFITGNKIDKFAWEIMIPDSIAINSEDMLLKVSNHFDFTNNSLSEIRFINEEKGKKTFFANIKVENRVNHIHGSYIGHTTYPNEYLFVKINNRDTILIGNVITHNFKLQLQKDSSDITVRAQDPFFSWFINLNDEQLSYGEYIERYIEMATNVPDSRYLMSNLALMINRYQSKKDLELIYNKLTDKHKNMVWAKKIEGYLHAKFENSSLRTLKENTYEDIVQDYTKYNLVIFSASWCRPCIEEILILKQIYKDLNKELILNHVSIDDEKSIGWLKKLVRNKNIPWRTLFAYNDTNKIKKKYYLNGIPHCLLVHHNKDMEIIDVRNDKQRKMLYQLVNSL